MFNQNHTIMIYKNLLRGIISAFLFLQIFSVGAQNADQKWSLGFHGALIEPQSSLGSQFYDFTINSTTFGQGLSLNHYLNKSFDLGLFGVAGKMAQSKGAYNYNDLVFALDLRLRYKLYNGYLLNEEAIIGPYITGGVGGAHGTVDALGKSEGRLKEGINQLDLYAGAGIRFRVNEYINLN